MSTAVTPQLVPADPTQGGPPPPAHHIPAYLTLLTRLVIMPLMALSTTFFGCISLVCGLWDKSGRQQHLVARTWAYTLVHLALSRVQIVNADKLKHASVAVYASNHLSYMDTPVLFAYLPFQFRILAKQQLWKIPFVGWYLNRSGQVPIDARSSRSAVAGLLRGVAALKSGISLVLFPEGARSPDGHLQAAASGCAFMAIRAGVPLVPLALIGTYELLPIHVYSLHPRPLKIIVGDPISTEGLTTKDADTLTARLYAEISRMYYQHSELDAPSLPPSN
jgi:1-acyl-sn-glycerol-3-phosphate acyltransferase